MGNEKKCIFSQILYVLVGFSDKAYFLLIKGDGIKEILSVASPLPPLGLLMHDPNIVAELMH